MTGANSGRLLFLSHAGADSQRALDLAAQISASPDAQRCGLKIWIDKKSLVPGSSWQEQLEQAIAEDSTAFGILLTREGARNWVRMEVRVALDRVIAAQQGGTAYPFIPIIADDVADIALLPPFARQYQGVRLDTDGGGLRELIRVAADIDHEASVALVDEPFMGLEAFEADSAALFFGRTDETAELVARLKTTNFVMVVGDSGSGKSSLVKAGLVPAFREGAFADPLGKRPELTDWHVVEMRPGRDAFAGLAEGVERAARRLGKSAADIGTFNDWVRSASPEKILDALRLSGAEGASLLLIVDQFEELWTQELNPERRASFLNMLLVVAEAGVFHRRVVGTMRRDYYHLTSDHDGLRARLAVDDARARYLLGAMSEAGLRQAVEKPLGLAGIPEPAAKALADEVVRDVAGQPGNLALLEMALTESWRRRGSYVDDLRQAYDGIGRLEGALATAAEDVFWNPSGSPNKLAEAERPIAEAIFMRLARVGDAGGATRRIMHWSELEPPAQEIARKLTTKDCNRLLVIQHTQDEGDPPTDANVEPTVELAHEQLITQWRDYRAWLRGTGIARHAADPERAKNKRALDRLIDTAESWRQRGQSQADLARGGDLEDFTGLLARRESWLSRSERDFVSQSQDASRRAADEQRRQLRLARIRTWVSVAFASMFLAVGATAAWKWNEASSQLSRANNALALGIWSDLDPPGDAPLNPQYRNALWRLARERIEVRDAFFEHLQHEVTNQLRFGAMAPAIARALGFDRPTPEQARQALEAILGTIKITSDYEQIQAKARALGTIAGRFSPEGAQPALTAIIGAIRDTENRDLKLALVQAIPKLAGRVTPNRAPEALESVIALCRETHDYDLLQPLTQSVKQLASHLSPEQVQGILTGIFATMRETPEYSRDFAFGQILPSLIESLPPRVALALLAPAIEAFRDSDSYTSDLSLGVERSMRSFAGKLAPDLAAAAQVPVVEAMLTTEDHFELPMLAEMLRMLHATPAPDRVQAVVASILGRMKAAGPDAGKLHALAKTLQALSVALTPEQTQTVRATVLDAIRATKDAGDLLWLAETARIVELAPEQVQAAQEQVLAAFGISNDPYALRALAQAMQALSVKLAPEQSRAALEQILAVLKVTTEPEQVLVLAEAMKSLSVPLAPEEASALLEQILGNLTTSKDPQQELVLAKAIQTLPAALAPEQAVTVLKQTLGAINLATDPDQLQALVEQAGAFTANVTPEFAVDAFAYFSDDPSKESSAPRAAARIHLLQMFADRIPPEVFQKLIDESLSIARSGGVQACSPRLGQALQALAAKLKPAEAETLLLAVIKCIQPAGDPAANRDLAGGVKALAAKTSPDQVPAALKSVRLSLAWAGSDEEAAAWASAYSDLLLRAPSPDRVRQIVEALRFPMAGGVGTGILLDTLHKIDPASPGSDAGLDANLDWLRQAYPAISLDTAPECPEPPQDSGLSCPKA